MTRRIGNIVIIEEELPQQCDLCGLIDELRPYGPNGEAICYPCGMKHPVTTEARMNHHLYGDPL